MRPRFAALLLAMTISVARPALAAPAADTDLAEARALSQELVQKLGAALKAQLAAGGPESAVGVCRDLAPAIAGELSRRSGARVARVSLKMRNPLLGTPDAWEQAALADFDAAVAGGQPADKLERAEVVDEPAGRTLRYVKAIPAAPLCMSCHGGADAIPAPVAAKIAAEYPHDRAVGYAPGQVRGAVTIRKRLD
ncbi:MAG: DUF3365 domain-containing protein [Burkholderiales bacterium]|jgi:hypothetical protein|nr:DUF3365 domain-containing protein [Burkholderiales bacterium]